MKLVNISSPDEMWSFNIFSYQFLFMLGTLFGHKSGFKQLFSIVTKNKINIAVPFILLIIGYFIQRHDLLSISGTWLVDKGGLGPIRIMHFFIVLTCLMSGLHLTKKFSNTPLFKLIETIGRQSLSSFITSVVCAYVSLGIWIKTSQPTTLYLPLVLSSLIIMLVVAVIIDRKNMIKKS
ncbi:OpgC domain-containing protein [Alteromonas naphthalenivorans]|uniref:OpgC domain-containing protein n=1 Tax=Alteromonas naphthalenivorans TaxID=715451 RepID=UPI003AA8E639